MTRIAAALVAFAALVTSVSAATFEVPGNGGKASGIGYVSGWKCPPNDNVTLELDGGAPIPVPSRVRRNDTAGPCGNDGRNGYITQFNFGLLADGGHTAVLKQNGVQFAGGSFTVVTFGTPFLTGAAGTYQLPNFPSAGQTATVEWIQGAQNFVIVGKSSGPSQGCPATGPATNLLVDCSANVFFYTKGGVVAGITSDGEDALICVTSVTSSDIVCVAGPVTSATTFNLTIGNANSGPFLPLDAGSSGNISGNGQTLNFTVNVGGESFPFTGLAYNSRQVLEEDGDTAVLGAAVNDVLSALRAGVGSTADGPADPDIAAGLAAALEALEK